MLNDLWRGVVRFFCSNSSREMALLRAEYLRFSGRLTKIDRYLARDDDFAISFAALESRVREVESRLASIEESVGRLRGDVGVAQVDLDVVHASINRMKRGFRVAANDVNEVEA